MKYLKIRVLLVIAIMFSVNAFSQIENNLLKVQGKALIYEIPELMVVNISISSQDSIYSKCSEKLISNYNQIEKSFIKNGIPQKKLKSDGLNLNESYYWSERKRIKDGYKGNISVILELPYNSKSLNTVMNTLKGNGFPVTYNLSFKLSNEQKDKLLQKAIELAVEDANKKAKYIASSLNVKLSKIQDVNFGYTSYQSDLLTSDTDVFYVMDKEEVEQALNLNPQKLEIKKTIGIIWTIEQ